MVHIRPKLLLLLGCLAAQAVAADDALERPLDKWGVGAGVFFADQNMATRFELNIGDISASVDFERDLGMRASQSVFRLTGFYKLSDKHQFDLDVFDLSQTATVRLETEIEWGDEVFPIGADLLTGLDLTIYKAAYTYHFWRGPKFRLGATGGLYIADIGLRMRLLSDNTQEVGSVTAPLPVLGFRGEYFFTERWRGFMSFEWFGLEFDDYDGTLDDSMLGIDYRPFDHVAFGVGINHVDIHVDTTEKNLRADLDWRYSGYFAYMRWTFQ